VEFKLRWESNKIANFGAFLSSSTKKKKTSQKTLKKKILVDSAIKFQVKLKSTNKKERKIR
jgi:hypothetical protein